MNDVSGNESPKENITANDNEETLENDESQNSETVVYIENPIDYSGYFENLQTIGIFISALLVAYGLAFAFIKGFKR